VPILKKTGMPGENHGRHLRQDSGFLRELQFPRTNKTDRHEKTEILLKVVLSIITLY
jgi:hypothetical protein